MQGAFTCICAHAAAAITIAQQKLHILRFNIFTSSPLLLQRKKCRTFTCCSNFYLTYLTPFEYFFFFIRVFYHNHECHFFILLDSCTLQYCCCFNFYVHLAFQVPTKGTLKGYLSLFFCLFISLYLFAHILVVFVCISLVVLFSISISFYEIFTEFLVAFNTHTYVNI